MKYVNQPVRKTDAMALVTGKPVYTDDLAPADCLIVKILRSPHANAWVEDIKTGNAEKVAGIACILTYKDVPQVDGVPLIADMSSMICSEPVDVSKYGAIYFGVQKNIAPAGMAVAIIREDLLGGAAKGLTPDSLPTMMNYTTLLNADSMYNTPPCWCIYMTGLVLKYLENDIGGLANMQKINEAKAKVLYDYLDGQDFFTNPVEHRYRSTMNVTFTSPNADLDKKFCAEAAEAGFVNLKGHRLVGGMRASIYNAMPTEGVDKLVDFMEKFRKENA